VPMPACRCCNFLTKSFKLYLKNVSDSWREYSLECDVHSIPVEL